LVLIQKIMKWVK